MKKRILAAVLCGVLIAGLAGCGNTAKKEGKPDSTVTADVTSDNELSGDISAEPDAPTESENPADSIPETQQQAEETEPPAEPSGTESSSEPKQPVRTEEETNSVSSEPQLKEPETQKPTPEPTQSSAEDLAQSEPTQEGTPPQESAPPEEPSVPEFNIQTWIDFAVEYAASESIGLNLSPDATACWDNPITASPHSLYLERDIQSRLNRYSKDEDITDVWIWAEERSDGSYDLYIGYA